MVAIPVRAVLFDLDDTLLENNMDRFLKGYFGLLAPHVAHLVPPDIFMPALLAATRAMVEHTDATLTNQQASWPISCRAWVAAEEASPVFEDFYATRFGALRELTQPSPHARRRGSGRARRGLRCRRRHQSAVPGDGDPPADGVGECGRPAVQPGDVV